jgi:hypothetical protein
MKSVATIRNNDPDVTRRVHLYIKRISIDGKWAYSIFSGPERDDCNITESSREAAERAIYNSWGRATCWDLRWRDA